MTDDLDATLAQMRERGVTIASEPSDQGWGVLAAVEVPGVRAGRALRAAPPGASLTARIAAPLIRLISQQDGQPCPDIPAGDTLAPVANHRMIEELSAKGFARSPFPPIADYGFLSDCETTALVAPSGNVEWMCLPRMDSPSVFGAILDRDAGGFRLGPAGVHGAGRAPLPAGHDDARDELGHAAAAGSSSATSCSIGPWHHDGRALAARTGAPRPTTTPTTSCCARSAASTARCSSRSTASRCSTTAARAARWEYAGDGYHEGGRPSRTASTSSCA